MIKHFYSFIVETESIEVELNNLDLSKEEKKHLLNLVESNLHNTVIDTVLSELSEEDKKIFLGHVHEKDHVKIWKLLHEKIEGIEEKIKTAAQDLKKELHNDLKEAKNS